MPPCTSLNDFVANVSEVGGISVKESRPMCSGLSAQTNGTVRAKRKHFAFVKREQLAPRECLTVQISVDRIPLDASRKQAETKDERGGWLVRGLIPGSSKSAKLPFPAPRARQGRLQDHCESAFTEGRTLRDRLCFPRLVQAQLLLSQRHGRQKQIASRRRPYYLMFLVMKGGK